MISEQERCVFAHHVGFENQMTDGFCYLFSGSLALLTGLADTACDHTDLSHTFVLLFYLLAAILYHKPL